MHPARSISYQKCLAPFEKSLKLFLKKQHFLKRALYRVDVDHSKNVDHSYLKTKKKLFFSFVKKKKKS